MHKKVACERFTHPSELTSVFCTFPNTEVLKSIHLLSPDLPKASLVKLPLELKLSNLSVIKYVLSSTSGYAILKLGCLPSTDEYQESGLGQQVVAG